MATGFVAGAKDTFADSSEVILDIRDGLDFLDPKMHGLQLLRRLGINGDRVAKSMKHSWNRTALAGRRENVTLADGTGTTLTVGNAKQYQVNNILRVESELLRVTAIASGTTLTVTRGYGGTTGAAHSAKPLVSLGSADPENSTLPAGIADTGEQFFNYVQTFTRAVELSNDEILSLNVAGNPWPGQLERRFIEIQRELAMATLYGIKYLDSTNKLRTMGGILSFLSTNVQNVGGALTKSLIDAKILSIVNAGGDPKIIALSPYQKQVLDAFDNSYQHLTKQEHTGGGLITQQWQSGVLDHPLDVVVDMTMATTECLILDPDDITIMAASNNGVDGHFAVVDGTAPGQDGKKQGIRGKYTLEVGNDEKHAYLYNLS